MAPVRSGRDLVVAQMQDATRVERARLVDDPFTDRHKSVRSYWADHGIAIRTRPIELGINPAHRIIRQLDVAAPAHTNTVPSRAQGNPPVVSVGRCVSNMKDQHLRAEQATVFGR